METPDQRRESFRRQNALNERMGMHTAGMNKANTTEWISLIRSAAGLAPERKGT